MSRARGGLRWALACGLVALAPVAAQAQVEPPARIEVPSGDGTIRGRVVHAERPDAAADVDVVLYALPSGAPPGLRHARSDADGRFAFEGIGTDSSIAYLVGARFGGVPYPGARVRFAADQREVEVEVPVADVVAEGSIAVDEHRIALAPRGASVAVQETLVIENPGTRTLFVPTERREGARPPVRFALPPGATEFSTPFGLVPEGLEQDGETLRWWGPVYPGSQTLEFGYELPHADEAPLSVGRSLPFGAARVVLRVPAQGVELEAPGFALAPDEAEAGWRKWQRDDLAPGSHLAASLRLPPARRDPSAVSFAEVRVVLDPDAAALRVREEHVLSVSGETPVIAPTGGRLARIALPAEAENLRFGSNAAAIGLTADPAGGLAVLGPLPPGETHIEVVYLLPSGVRETVLARRFDAAVPLLSVYVADTGRMALRSDRLHRRRPVLTGDRTFAHLEAFQVAAGETVSLEIGALPPRRGLPRWAEVAALLLLAAAAVGLLLAPLRDAEARAPASVQETAAEREREGVYAALEDLEHDHETGKVEDVEYGQLREELRARAVASLRAERDALRGGEAAAEPPPKAGCPACGAEPRPDDRFCASCGNALGATGEREARA